MLASLPNNSYCIQSKSTWSDEIYVDVSFFYDQQKLLTCGRICFRAFLEGNVGMSQSNLWLLRLCIQSPHDAP